MFVFAYHLTAEASPVPVEQIFLFRDAAYAFVGVPLDQYARAARPLSQRWGTVCMPAAEFRQQARSLHDLLLPAVVG